MSAPKEALKPSAFMPSKWIEEKKIKISKPRPKTINHNLIGASVRALFSTYPNLVTEPPKP